MTGNRTGFASDGRRWREGAQTIGSTDDLGLRAARGSIVMHDLHASILHLLGLELPRVDRSTKAGHLTTAVEGDFWKRLVTG
ncbi:MAG: hypothetical protein U0936_03630 [Planctomycetaceae bacterium]